MKGTISQTAAAVLRQACWLTRTKVVDDHQALAKNLREQEADFFGIDALTKFAEGLSRADKVIDPVLLTRTQSCGKLNSKGIHRVKDVLTRPRAGTKPAGFPGLTLASCNVLLCL